MVSLKLLFHFGKPWFPAMFKYAHCFSLYVRVPEETAELGGVGNTAVCAGGNLSSL